MIQANQIKPTYSNLWLRSWPQFKQNRLGLLGLFIIIIFFMITLAVWFGLLGQNWSETSNLFNQKPSSEYWFGTNSIGQDVAARGLYATRVAFEVGFLVAICSSLIGAGLGAIAGFKQHSWLDALILWLMGVLDSIPFYLFVAAIAYALDQFVFAMHIAMITVFWTETARIVRGEVIKLKNMAYIDSAVAMGQTEFKIILKHIFPNISHLLIIQATITFVVAIKTEVILSFLGLGIKNGISWGLMLAEATNDIQAGYFNNFIVASSLLFILVIGFNLFSDALQDALNPQLNR